MPKPFKVGSLSFDFTHVLVAGQKANDLVLVIDLKSDAADDVAIRKVLALTRALDVIGSRRPVTAVLTSVQLGPTTVRSMSNVCRVLPLGAPAGPSATDAVRDWLSVLLPLKQPNAEELQVEWERDLRGKVSQDVRGDFLEALVVAAPQGKVAVELTFSSAMDIAIAPALQENQIDE